MRYRIKRLVPPFVIHLTRFLRPGYRAARSRQASVSPRLVDQFPWSSPNVWARLEASYRPTTHPTIGEYGTGASTIWHVRNLVEKGGGTYIGVEDDPDWFFETVAGLLAFAARRRCVVSLQVDYPDAGPYACDASVSFDPGVCALLRLRPLAPDAGDSTDCAYVEAIDRACEVVVIDGKIRKACVNHVLDQSVVRPGGTIALFEAGRGTTRWLGAPTLSGDQDYRPEVARMLALGGELVDGNGLDRWEGLTQTRSSPSVRRHYPLEACFLLVSK